MKTLLLLLCLLSSLGLYADCEDKSILLKDPQCFIEDNEELDFKTLEIFKEFKIEDLNQLYERSIGAESGGGGSSTSAQMKYEIINLDCRITRVLSGGPVIWKSTSLFKLQNSLMKTNESFVWEHSISSEGSPFKRLAHVLPPYSNEGISISASKKGAQYTFETCLDLDSSISQCFNKTFENRDRFDISSQLKNSSKGLTLKTAFICQKTL